MTPPPAAMASIVRLGRVDSTQAVVFALAADGAPDRTVVVADTQAAGRGRRGRTWHDEPGTSLLTSILLRPRLAPAQLPMLSLAAAVAIAEALARVAGVLPRLKWPNDVLVEGRKIAGILLESRMVAARPAVPTESPAGRAAPESVVALGIGINVGQRIFPAELVDYATSIRLAAGRDVERDVLLTAVLDALDHWRARLELEGFAPVRERWRALAHTLGRTVSVDGISGVAVDLDEDGALLVDDGEQRRRVVAGEVSVR
jgi:BirA family transcriptional regulator, biotin operon repressor / biotin---[acetyl-CoA-carboxylase] ligase